MYHICFNYTLSLLRLFFFFKHPATTEIYTLSLHDALPIFEHGDAGIIQCRDNRLACLKQLRRKWRGATIEARPSYLDRKSTRLNSSHVSISYAVFCLKKKKKNHNNLIRTQHNILSTIIQVS